MGTLPMDIVLGCILPKLPAKSLIRFKCVSKSFLAEILSPKFIKQHHYNAISSNSNRLLILPIAYSLYVYDLDSLHSLPLICPYPDVTFFAPCMSVVATCGGYLLIGCGYTQLGNLIVLNPSTRTYREICCEDIPCNSENIRYGMCHCPDEFYDEYKVVRFVEFCRSEGLDELEVMVYNTTTNTWKVVESETAVDTFISWDDNTPVLVQNHLLHMLFFNQGHRPPSDRIKRIGCFDMKAERWANDVQLPDIISDENGSNYSLRKPCNLGELDGQLCFSGNNVIESSFELWVMKEYGMKESWVKLIRLHVSSNLDSPQLWRQSYHPLAYRTKSPHEILYNQGYTCNLYWYNLRDKEAIKAEFQIPPPHNTRITSRSNLDILAYICKGSLLNFPRAKPIRVSSEEEDADEDDEEEGDDDDDEDFVHL